MLENILKEYFGLINDYEKTDWYNSYGLLINLLYELDKLGVITDVNKIIDKLDKIDSEVF